MAEQSKPAASMEFGLGQRVLHMSLLWLGFGAVVGALSAPAQDGLTGLIAGIVAGMIVLPVVGAVLGLVGARWRESLVGGLFGLAFGCFLAVFTGQALTDAAKMGLLCGALVGATCLSLLNGFRKSFSGLRRRQLS